MIDLPEYVEGLPNICGSEALVDSFLKTRPLLPPPSARSVDFGRIQSACAVALHMHQPLVPAGGENLGTAELVSNLKRMFGSSDPAESQSAVIFPWCFQRMGQFVPQLLNEGKQPRVMLEYSGTLLHGLRKMGFEEAFEDLRHASRDSRYRHAIEWLGCPWGHALAPSTPPQDYRYHVRAWQHHFASIFGWEALQAVRGFSPTDLALPNHPDVAYEFVKTLRDCGFDWVLVREDSVEEAETGAVPRRKHIPHRLVCRNSSGREVSIIAIILAPDRNGSSVARMEAFNEARSLSRVELAGKRIPPLLAQIANGENGPAMAHEFESKYFETVRENSGADAVLMNVSEYLAHLEAIGIHEKDFPAVQPACQKYVWERFPSGSGPERLAAVIGQLRNENSRFGMEDGVWTNNLSWMRTRAATLDDLDAASAHFQQKIILTDASPDERRYRNALFHLLCGQTSCYRHWKTGMWVDYRREITRRLEAILKYDF
jgi:hypothetical protein